jgi:hypothetical protein
MVLRQHIKLLSQTNICLAACDKHLTLYTYYTPFPTREGCFFS